jgi:hypothetical protein
MSIAMVSWATRRDWVLFAPLSNLLGLIAGGIGWGLSRHSRPNASHRLCGWMNFLNWVLFGGIVFVAFIRAS